MIIHPATDRAVTRAYMAGQRLAAKQEKSAVYGLGHCHPEVEAAFVRGYKGSPR